MKYFKNEVFSITCVKLPSFHETESLSYLGPKIWLKTCFSYTFSYILDKGLLPNFVSLFRRIAATLLAPEMIKKDSGGIEQVDSLKFAYW